MSTMTSTGDQEAIRVANRYAAAIEKATTLLDRSQACDDAAAQYRRDAHANTVSAQNHQETARTIRNPALAHQHTMAARDAEAEAAREILAARAYEAQAETYLAQARSITPAGGSGTGPVRTGAAGHTPASADTRANTGRATADEQIRPQWPGHKPPRRWEWMVRAHKPDDSRNTQWALPSIDLATEQALRAYVQDLLQRYDWVQLHHWYSGSELTFTRQADGSVTVNRRQLNPTAGAPGHRRDF